MVASLHVVRRYGPVGGMENYVYHLTQELVKQDQSVIVLCEQDCRDETIAPTPSVASVTVVVLGNGYRKPRWLAQWGFSKRVSRYLALNSDPFDNGSHHYIVHSHERTASHHVTTFHGPPFANRKKRWLDFLSPRIHMWSWLERRELLGSQVRAILPNSPLIAEQLRALYPAINKKIRLPAYPGVDKRFSNRQAKDNSNVVGFLGREWKRKGLDIAVRVVEQLRRQDPDIHFVVAGCDASEIAHLFQGWPKSSYSLMGWIDDSIQVLEKISLILHPARVEPFGMVIAEANAAGLPVVVSQNCGAAALITEAQGRVCGIESEGGGVMHWVAACEAMLQRSQSVTSLNLTWESLAQQHITLYRELSHV